WTVFAPVEEWPVEPCSTALQPADLGAPVVEVALAPGDVLYVPRGFPHVAVCGEVDSLHLTLSIRTMTWAEAIGALGRQAPRLRRSVARGADGGAAALVRQLRDEMLPALADLPLDAFLRERASLGGTAMAVGRHGRLAAIAATDQLSSDTVLERVPGVG